MMNTGMILCARCLAVIAFGMMGLFGCAAPEVEHVDPVLAEVDTAPSVVNLRDIEEIEEVPLITGIKEALKEGNPVEVEMTTVPTFRALKPEKGNKYKGHPISLRCQNADLLEVLDRFAEISGLNLVLHPGVSGTVTVRLENIPWDQALDIILKMHNLRFAIEGNVLRIGPVDVFRRETTQRVEQQRQQLEAQRVQAESAPLKTKLISVNFADPSTITVIIQQVIGAQ